MTPLRTAIVGSGFVARVHAAAVRDLGGTVAAVCSRTLAGAQALAGEVGGVIAYDSLEELLDVAEHVTGARISEVLADFRTFVPGRALEDHASLLLRFDNGAAGSAEFSALGRDARTSFCSRSRAAARA
jgi:predicted dehydrogenase